MLLGMLGSRKLPISFFWREEIFLKIPNSIYEMFKAFILFFFCLSFILKFDLSVFIAIGLVTL